MSSCHHIVTGLNNTYYCLKCLYCEYSVDHGDSANHGDSADHEGNADHGDSGYHAETVLHGKTAENKYLK